MLGHTFYGSLRGYETELSEVTDVVPSLRVPAIADHLSSTSVAKKP